MDQNKKVTVLTVNGRRQNVPITPSTTILQILEQVCQKHSFPSDEYSLKHHNKEVDLTQMFRFSGLPNNCLLEMFQTDKKRTEQQVDLCVQLENGERFQNAFLPSATLLEVLKNLCPAELASDRNPVVIYMRTDIFGDDLETRTLKSLGIISGRAMVRVLNKTPEDLKTQANVYIPPTPKEPKVVEEQSTAAKPKPTEGTTAGFSITKDLVKTLKESKAEVSPLSSNDADSSKEKKEDVAENVTQPEPVKEAPKYDWGTGVGQTIRSTTDISESTKQEQSEMEVEEKEDDPLIVQLGERNAVLFSLESHQKNVDELPESFFELTVNDLKTVLRDLNKVQSGTDDAPLLTTKMRELEENKKVLNKFAQYKNTVIRIQFPDRHVLQGNFKPVEKMSDVYEFVRKYLKNSELKFHLFTTPPKNIIAQDVTLIESDCVPTVVLHFGVDEEEDNKETAFLQDDLLEKLSSADGALKAARLAQSNNNALERKDSGPDCSTGAIRKRPRNDDFRQSSAGAGSSTNVPKWFQPIRK